jgi:transposase-like protein
MPNAYAPKFRQKVVNEVLAGRRVPEVAAAADLAESTVYRWVNQERIARNVSTGGSSDDDARRSSTADDASLQTVPVPDYHEYVST